MNRLLSHLVARVGESAELDDAALLAAFVQQRDEDAFAVLVHRHGPMVYGVCRRWLREPADLDDAFQATFLVLVRRAAAVNRPQQLASWLHGVARHIARRQRQRACREELRSQLEVAAKAPEFDPDLGPLLDDEIGRLPEHYRSAIVLCHLQGMSRRQAAQRLGCPEGTLSAWLARAMLRLRRRLIRRGVAPAAATVAALTPAVVDAVPAELERAAVVAVSTSSLSASVLALSRGVLRMMMFKRLSAAAILTGFLLTFGAGTAFLGRALVEGPAAVAQQPGNDARRELGVEANLEATLDVRIRAAADGKSIDELLVLEGKDRVTVNTTAALGRYLKRVRLDKSAPQHITVTAPRTMQFAQVNEVIDVCRNAGFANVQIVASDRQDTERKIAESKKQLDDLNRALNERNFDINPIEDKVVDGRIDWRGKVLETDGKLTKVSLGRNHKIKVGDELHVYRLQPNPEYLGRLKVIKVEADQSDRSLCEFTPATRGAAIRTNDIVATGMPGRETTQSEAIALKHGNAGDVAKVIQELFVGPKGDSQRIRVTFDASSNALIVQASPTDLGTIRKLIDLLDQKASKTLGSNRSGATDEKELDRDIAIAQERLAEFRDMAKSLETAKSGNKEQLEDRKVKLIEVNQLISDLETQLRELDRRRELLHMVRALRAQGRDEEASAELLNVARAASLPPAGKDVPMLDGQWKGASGEWVIAGDRLFIHRGGEITVAKLALGKRGGYNSIDITLDTNVIHHGVYAVTDDRLTVYLLDRSTPGDSRKTTDFISLTFDRHQKSTKPADPFHR